MSDEADGVQALSAAQAALVTLSAAIASGDSRSVEEEARRAIAAGARAGEIYEAVLQSYLFLGFPRAIEGLFAVHAVLERTAGLPSKAADGTPADWRSAGEALCRKVYGKNYEKLMLTMRGLSPDLADSMILEGYGKTLSRPGLGAVEREYCVVAILTVTRMERQLRSHAMGAVNVGGSRAGVRETIARSSPWAGEDAVRKALDVTGLQKEGHARD
jgi:4-carboxymuconolactone decarboxylase